MRPDAPLIIDLPASVVWVTAVASAACLAVALSCVWLWRLVQTSGGASVSGAAAWTVGVLLYAVQLVRAEIRQSSVRLAWDDQGWSLERDGKAVRGRLAKSIDVGGVMLLRFSTSPTRSPLERLLGWIGRPIGRVDWVAVTQGMMSPRQWHHLRCLLGLFPRPVWPDAARRDAR